MRGAHLGETDLLSLLRRELLVCWAGGGRGVHVHGQRHGPPGLAASGGRGCVGCVGVGLEKALPAE